MKIYRAGKSSFFRCAVFFLAILVNICALAGCTGQQEDAVDILTQKTAEEGRTQITVLIKHAFSINAFEEAVEQKFPDIDLIQVGNYTSALDSAEYEARLKNDDLTDIIMTWPLSFGAEYWDDRLLDLSAMPFTSKYNVSMLNTISHDGKLYYLPGPAQVRGIVYNKTLFEENGWQVPTGYEEFLELCETIEKTGIRSIQLGFKNPEVLDTAFVGFGYGDCFSTPKDAQWIADYANGEGRFQEQFEPALDTFQEMIDAGIWKAADLNVNYSDREKLLFSRQCAMVEDSVLIARSGYQKGGSTDEFALMPFFNPGGDGNDWARLYMVCYIGLNKHLAEKQSEDKYEKVLKLMDYISTPEGQEALAADTGAMYSSLKGVDPPNVPETQDLVSTLEHGRYAIFPELDRVRDTLREGLAGMVSGELTKEQVAEMVDEANRSAPVEDKGSEIMGTAAKDFTLIETGNFITDVMREKCGTEIALFLDGGKDGRYNSRGVTAKLYQGDVTVADIGRVLPDLKYGEQGEIWKVEMTGEDLMETLEFSIAIDNNNTGWFYYFSGLKMCYDPAAEPGSRIQSISMADGKALEPDRLYTVAVTENSVPEDKMASCEKTGVLIKDIIADEIRTQNTISPSGDGRFKLP